MSFQRTPNWRCGSLAIGTALIILNYVGGGIAVARDQPKEKEESATMNGISIELILPKDKRYKPSDKVAVEVLFRNTSKEEVKIPVIEDDKNVLFYDFLIVGDRRTGQLISNGGEWSQPSKKSVKLISIASGATYRQTLKEAIRLGDFKFDGNEQHQVLVIYRDCSYGHGIKDEKMLKGVATSSLVPLKIDIPPE